MGGKSRGTAQELQRFAVNKTRAQLPPDQHHHQQQASSALAGRTSSTGKRSTPPRQQINPLQLSSLWQRLSRRASPIAKTNRPAKPDKYLLDQKVLTTAHDLAEYITGSKPNNLPHRSTP